MDSNYKSEAVASDSHQSLPSIYAVKSATDKFPKMKAALALLALIGIVVADVSHLSNTYLPPTQPQPQYLPPAAPAAPPPQQTYLPPAPQQSYIPPAPQQTYLPPQPEQQYLPPVSVAQPTQEYLPPVQPSAELASDGYHYRAVKRYRLRTY